MKVQAQQAQAESGRDCTNFPLPHCHEDSVQLVRQQAAWGPQPNIEQLLSQPNDAEPLLPLKYGTTHQMMAHHLARIARPSALMNLTVYESTSALTEDGHPAVACPKRRQSDAQRSGSGSLGLLNMQQLPTSCGMGASAGGYGAGSSDASGGSTGHQHTPGRSSSRRSTMTMGSDPQAPAMSLTSSQCAPTGVVSGHAPLSRSSISNLRQSLTNPEPPPKPAAPPPADDDMQSAAAMYPPLSFESRFESGNLRSAVQVRRLLPSDAPQLLRPSEVAGAAINVANSGVAFSPAHGMKCTEIIFTARTASEFFKVSLAFSACFLLQSMPCVQHP